MYISIQMTLIRRTPQIEFIYVCMKLREREKGKDKKRRKKREGQERATRTYTSLTIVITNFKSYLIRFLLHIA